jgi:hypothetical protein
MSASPPTQQWSIVIRSVPEAAVPQAKETLAELLDLDETYAAQIIEACPVTIQIGRASCRERV